MQKFENAKALYAKMHEGDDRAPIPIEARVRKVDSDERDAHPNGTEGTVTGSLFCEDFGLACYLVNFVTEPPGVQVFIMGSKIEQIDL